MEEEPPAENIYENIDDVKPAETDLGDGAGKRPRKKKTVVSKRQLSLSKIAHCFVPRRRSVKVSVYTRYQYTPKFGHFEKNILQWPGAYVR